MFCRNKTSLRDPHHGVRSADFQVVCKFLDELPRLLCSRLIMHTGFIKHFIHPSICPLNTQTGAGPTGIFQLADMQMNTDVFCTPSWLVG